MKKEKSQWILQKYKKTVREHYEQLYANKFENLKKNGQLSRGLQPTKTESRRNILTEQNNN